MEKQRLNHTIQITCNSCLPERTSAPVSMKDTLKPFLVIQTSPLPQRYRTKRNSNCQPEMKECCRDELYISFAEIGWSDWILHPTGYHAYFCRGTCSTAVSRTMTGSYHNDVIMVRKFIKFFQKYSLLYLGGTLILLLKIVLKYSSFNYFTAYKLLLRLVYFFSLHICYNYVSIV